MKTLDSRVADVLKVKMELGLFDNPYVKDVNAADKIAGADKNMDFVLEIQKQSLVLLKNEGKLLPMELNRKWKPA